VILVSITVDNAGDNALPDTAVSDWRELVFKFLPIVELSEHRAGKGVGRPRCEVDAIVDGRAIRSVVEPDMSALVEQMQVVGGQHRYGTINRIPPFSSIRVTPWRIIT